MQSRVLWVYAAVVTVALVVAFVQETGVAGDPSLLALVDPMQEAVLALDVALVWVFAALAVKARIFEPARETVREAAALARGSRVARARIDAPDSGIFVAPSIGRL